MLTYRIIAMLCVAMLSAGCRLESNHMNQALRAELIQLDEHDQAVRAELAADGSLFDG